MQLYQYLMLRICNCYLIDYWILTTFIMSRMCYDINHMFMNVTMSGSSNIAKFQLENLHKLILYINNLQKISCEPTLNISNCDCNEKLSNLTIPSQLLVFSQYTLVENYTYNICLSRLYSSQTSSGLVYYVIHEIIKSFWKQSRPV